MFKILVYISLSVICVIVLIIQTLPEPHPDVGLRVSELIRKYGYPFEEHTVTTKDGYILTMHRIPHGKYNPNATNLPVVFIMHGLIACSGVFVLMGPDKGLGYVMADAGYDVWMGNARGTTYSMKHTKLDPYENRTEFWNFGLHEIGVYDLPAMIDYVLSVTGQEKIFFIGHSQGATVFHIMASMLPEYNDKIRVMIGLGSVVFMKNMPHTLIQLVSQHIEIAQTIFEKIGHFNFIPIRKQIDLVGRVICHDKSMLQEICAHFFFGLMGYDSEQLNRTMLPVIFSMVPDSCSSKQFIHYGQLIKYGQFRQFDYGTRNPKIYGQLDPPHYNMELVTTPIVLLYGMNDYMCSEQDTVILSKKLNTPMVHKVPHENFNHIDFIWGTYVVKLVHEKILEVFRNY